VNGAAAGAGFSLVAAVDLAIASESSSFMMAYTAAGLVPDGSSTFFLPRTLGRRRTLELMLLNRRLSAGEALDWGIVNRVVPDAELAAEAEKLATTLAAGPTGAYGLTKKLVLSTSETLEAQMELETRAISDVARTDDAKGGIRAFLEKRKPAFQGR
jgi:2-(1,2-epoxy-1,2-dihydrophenyl)acetyl-CoA isomerase